MAIDEIGHLKGEFTSKQAAMLNALEANLGIVTIAAQEVGIARQTHYNWVAENPDYAAAVKSIDSVVLDFAENALHKNMALQKEASIIFFLKTKGRERGYREIVDTNIKRDFAQMDDEEIDAMISEFQRRDPSYPSSAAAEL